MPPDAATPATTRAMARRRCRRRRDVVLGRHARRRRTGRARARDADHHPRRDEARGQHARVSAAARARSRRAGRADHARRRRLATRVPIASTTRPVVRTWTRRAELRIVRSPDSNVRSPDSNVRSPDSNVRSPDSQRRAAGPSLLGGQMNACALELHQLAARRHARARPGRLDAARDERALVRGEAAARAMRVDHGEPGAASRPARSCTRPTPSAPTGRPDLDLAGEPGGA